MKKGLSETCYRIFVNLVNSTRLAILEQLMNHPMRVNELVDYVGQEQSMISHNLKLLLNSNFVDIKNDKRKYIYSANKKIVGDLFRTVENHAKVFCQVAGNCRK